MIEEAREIVTETIRNYAYQIGFDLPLLKGELEELEDDIKNETTEVFDAIRTLPKKYNNRFCKIIGFKHSDRAGNLNLQAFIEINDFFSLSGISREHSLYFSENGNTMKFKSKYNLRRESEHELIVNDKVFSIDTERKTKRETRTKFPPKAKISQWTEKIEKLNHFCDQQLQKVDEYVRNDTESASSNLFVDKIHRNVAFANLDSISNQISSIRIELSKAQESYESIGQTG